MFAFGGVGLREAGGPTLNPVSPLEDAARA